MKRPGLAPEPIKDASNACEGYCVLPYISYNSLTKVCVLHCFYILCPAWSWDSKPLFLLIWPCWQSRKCHTGKLFSFWTPMVQDMLLELFWVFLTSVLINWNVSNEFIQFYLDQKFKCLNNKIMGYSNVTSIWRYSHGSHIHVDGNRHWREGKHGGCKHLWRWKYIWKRGELSQGENQWYVTMKVG